jgi:uncharacterized DUF497 family protein
MDQAHAACKANALPFPFRQLFRDRLRGGGEILLVFHGNSPLMLTERYKFYTFQFMKFEYDPAKSQSNKAKHGIDFEEAKALWNDVDRLHIPAVFRGEERYALIGRIGSLHWTAIFTYRGNMFRIISVRRSRKEEVEQYEKD